MPKRYLEQEEEQGLIGLPIELIKDIIERLSGKDLANLASVCSLLDRIIYNDNALWKRKFLQEEKFEYMPGDIYSCKAWKNRIGCPGIVFATATNEFVLANILHKFQWNLLNGTTEENLDRSESPGTTTHRKVPLLAVVTSCCL
ncbi:hypothetical protein POM88_025321 [Heracleum sosnowskyi]|uniref:F-box domain-containing protein n=1 Tax=Heracleum sosnowskyi TaxID=360622 RepID=A0AAD8I3S9_9APIA|nr:hypothetical protein POM88_025321 [Heracleum sosnowskyi]